MAFSYSIIIPTVGRRTLEKVLDAIYECDSFFEYSPEILVIFAGKKVWKKGLRAKFPGVDFYRSPEMGGLAVARNFAIDIAKGEVLIFLSDDMIPSKKWFEKIVEFHESFPEDHLGLMGKISWIPELANDPFHKWLEDYALFSHRKIKDPNRVNWRRFYLTNTSIKKNLIGEERLRTEFTSFGFEATEFAYRLVKKGFKLKLSLESEVFHDHPHNLQKMVQKFYRRRQNAELFEKLHPEIRVIPRGQKILPVKICLTLAKIFSPFLPEAKWWYEWKRWWWEKEVPPE